MSAPTRGRPTSRSRPASRPRPDARPRSGDGSGDRSRRAARTVDADDAPASPLAGPVADALSGLLAAVQAAGLSLAMIVLPALVAYLAAAASGAGPAPGADGEGGQNWRTPVEVASGIWLLGHGVPVTASGATLTLVPLGLTVLALFSCYVTARHAARATPRTWVVATGCYAAGTTAVAVAVPSVTAWSVLAAPVAGALVGGLGFGLGTLARGGAPTPAELGDRLNRLVRGWCPPTLRLGARAGLVAMGLLTGAAAVLVGVWAVAGRATSSDIIRALDPGWAGGIVLAVAQLALLPDLVLWAMAWLGGPGFAVGTGTGFTPFGADSGPLPAVPLLAALPGQDWTGGFGWAAPLVVVACGAAAGWFAWRRLEPGLLRWSDVALVLGGLAGTAGLLVGVLQAAASGAVGAERLSDVGATPWFVALLIAGELLVGAASVVLPAHLRNQHLRNRLADAGRAPGEPGVDLPHDERAGDAAL
ncbi:DUF6350 family protein [Myceligenerans pegani]|uniref:Integral membrane protein n=1 Tax=Myceligenerans pegani TaxID=2776917 RepID=A0ABR9MTS6_9MICO|nr:DUF6350 family protein [Myceligenerans sp. TRM 65318]MBE1874769.1 hypothetical protein [Myceligenerans sp. TRM 65318]MBE3017040.1 hypothetical protein [Myceligenerans sp. TRM 65318]